MIEEEKNSKECGDGLNDVIDTSLFQHSHTQLHKGLSSTAKRALLATIVFGAIVWLIIDSAIAGPIHGNVFSLVAGRNIKSVVFASADAGVIRQDPQANYGRMSTLDTFISTHEVFVRFDIGHIEELGWMDNQEKGTSFHAAKLRLYVDWAESNWGILGVDIFGFLGLLGSCVGAKMTSADPWSENTITWDTTPSAPSNYEQMEYIEKFVVYSRRFVEVDITHIIHAALSKKGSSATIRIVSMRPQWVKFSSRESKDPEKRPTLVVEEMSTFRWFAEHSLSMLYWGFWTVFFYTSPVSISLLIAFCTYILYYIFGCEVTDEFSGEQEYISHTFHQSKMWRKNSGPDNHNEELDCVASRESGTLRRFRNLGVKSCPHSRDTDQKDKFGISETNVISRSCVVCKKREQDLHASQ